MDLVEEVYSSTRMFPREEVYGLATQARRAVVSIPSNIAEGHSRRGTREFVHHLSIAHGSLSEVETQMLIALRLGYLKDEQVARFNETASEVGRLMNALEKHANH
jgi:four helix bundle protein